MLERSCKMLEHRKKRERKDKCNILLYSRFAWVVFNDVVIMQKA